MKKELLGHFIDNIENELIKIEMKNNSMYELNKKFAVRQTNTRGYHVELFKMKNTSGLDLWLDEFTNVGFPNLAITLWNKNAKAEGLRNILAEKSFQISKKDTKVINDDITLKIPLNMTYFNKYLIEVFDYTFITKYYYKAIIDQKSFTKEFVQEVLSDIASLIGILSKYHEDTLDFNEDYKTTERKYVILHKYQERDSKLALIVKRRAKYKCKICDFEFTSKYGELGRDFAEAHHKLPLSKLTTETETSIDDLICVCSNCHRMLHRMEGTPEDISKLKAIIGNASD